jgi:FixJ family two-component response regulator
MFQEAQVTDRLISVVDDDESVRWATVDLLASVGFRCQAFSSARLICNPKLPIGPCV